MLILAEMVRFICLSIEKTLLEKKRKCWYPAFSPFPSMFSKGFLLRIVKTGLFHKGLKLCMKSNNNTYS